METHYSALQSRAVCLVSALIISTCASVSVAFAQTSLQTRPDVKRALGQRAVAPLTASPRKDGYTPQRSVRALRTRPVVEFKRRDGSSPVRVNSLPSGVSVNATVPILPGTSLARVLHTSQLSLTTSAGTDEQYFDENFDLIADRRRTFDSDGGSFDLAVGKSGARYEAYSATDNNGISRGIVVIGADTNGDFVRDSFSAFDLKQTFGLPSAVAVVAGTSNAGREFVITSSSGYFNPNNPNDPNNEPSAGVVLLVRNIAADGFDSTLSRSIVPVGNNALNNANGLALLPNNNLLIADFDSSDLRIVRDTNGDGIPDTLDPTPYYHYQFGDDGPIDVAANSRGVVFSHGYGSNAVLLAIYDNNSDGRGETEEVVVQGLSLDDNLVFHGLSVDREGNVYVIEDASGASDLVSLGGNLGSPRIDAFPDPALNGILRSGEVFANVDIPASQALSGLALGVDPILGAVGRFNITNSASQTGGATLDSLATIAGTNLTRGASGMTEADAAQSGIFVTVEGQNARVLSFNNSQINIYVPKDAGALGPRSVLVFNASDIVAAEDVTVVNSNPGIFTSTGTGAGQAIALLASDFRYTIAPFDALTNGQPSVITVYGTGWRNALPMTATIGGTPVTVQYSGSAGDFPGLDEVVLVIPSGVTGNAAVVVKSADGKSSRSDVFIPVK
jgi:uncharacterized protein (TIGR03437 family)